MNRGHLPRFGQTVFNSLLSGFDHNPILNGLLFTNELWSRQILIGSDAPYWSLGFEVWYYIAFSALFFAPRWTGLLITACVFLITGPVVMIFFLPWLCGLWAYRATKYVSLGVGSALALSVGSALVALAAVRLVGPVGDLFASFAKTQTPLYKYGYCITLGAIFSLHLVGMSSFLRHLPELPTKWRMFARHLGDQTFTLYLFHMPIMVFIAAESPWDVSSWRHRLLVFVGVPLIIAPMAIFLERQKPLWRKMMASLVDGVIALCRARPRAAE